MQLKPLGLGSRNEARRIDHQVAGGSCPANCARRRARRWRLWRVPRGLYLVLTTASNLHNRESKRERFERLVRRHVTCEDDRRAALPPQCAFVPGRYVGATGKPRCDGAVTG